MRPWIRRWREAWHDEPVTMFSDLPIDVVRARMRASSSTWQQAAFRGGVKYGILGRIGEYDVDVHAGYIALADPKLPRFSGNLAPTANGTRASGWISRYLMLMWFSTAVLILVAVVFVFLVVVTTVDAFTSYVTSGQLLACVIPIPVAAALIGLSVLGSFSGRREVAYLKSWLADCLQATEGVDREGGDVGR